MKHLLTIIIAYIAAYTLSIILAIFRIWDVGVSDFTFAATLFIIAASLFSYGFAMLLQSKAPRVSPWLTRFCVPAALISLVVLLIKTPQILHACHITVLSRTFTEATLHSKEVWLLAFYAVGIPALLWGLALAPRLRIKGSFMFIVIGISCGILTTRHFDCLPESLAAQPQFGLFAMRDMIFSGSKQLVRHERVGRVTTTVFNDSSLGKVHFSNGRLVYADSAFLAPRVVNALLPFVLRPNGSRFAVRGPDAHAYLPFVQELIQDIPNGELTQGELKGKYDALFIAPPPNWLPQATSFVTSRFVERCARYLLPDGLLIYHFDTRAMDATMLMTRIKSIKKVLPYIQIWVMGPNDWTLVASAQPIQINLNAMFTVPQRPNATKLMHRAGLDTLIEILACYLCSADTLFEDLTVAINDTPDSKEYKAALPLLFEAPRGVRLFNDFESFRDSDMPWIIHDKDPEVSEAYRSIIKSIHFGRSQAVMANIALYTKPTTEALKQAFQAKPFSPKDLLLLDWAERLRIEAECFTKLAEHKRALGDYEAIIAITDAPASIYYAAGISARSIGEQDRAFAYFKRTVELAPNVTEGLFALAEMHRDLCNFAEAETLYDHILLVSKRQNEHLDALFYKAKLLSVPENERFNSTLAEQYFITLCDRTQWRNQAFVYALADLYINTQRIKKGVALKRRFKARPITPALAP